MARTSNARASRAAPAKGQARARRLVLTLGAALGAALAPLGCSQSALLGVSGVMVPQGGGTIEATDGDAPELKGFKLVLHSGDLQRDTLVTVRLGPESEDPFSAGPSIVLGPMGLQLLHPADLTLPYSLGPGQFDSELAVELEDGQGPPQRIDRATLSVDTSAHLLRCLLPRLGEVHALAPRHCQQDSQCGSAGYCHDQEICRPRSLPDGGMDPGADGGPHHP